ncbi:uncharacterized protein BDZ99DRAFT_470833 [Mytilinidion resinicola]|uniref:Uncharacterized protein n=1 Tax=Mytilinidion resinicola TaxID=574789 RepID=A0A6A6ZC44_9PEZI|nr:uncharacterized protein BDZ99DRAFT_470833 [Mytilinidion resinicola]KAF2817885.1 hypothetical protein BDZ99DRAFT_470833 [Mytilinidion resinicola]
MVYSELGGGAVIKYSYDEDEWYRYRRPLISETPKNPGARTTLAALMDTDADLGKEALAPFTQNTNPEFKDIYQMAHIYNREGYYSDSQERQLKKNLRFIGFRKLESYLVAELRSMLANIPLLRELVILPSKVPKNDNWNPDAFSDHQRRFIQRIVKSKETVLLFRDLKVARDNSERRTKVTFRADWDDAFEEHENNRPKCRKLAASGGKLTVEVRKRQTEELRVYFDEQVNEALNVFLDADMQADNERIARMEAKVAEAQANLVEARQALQKNQKLRNFNA